MPRRHAVELSDIRPENLKKAFVSTYERQAEDFETLLGLPGVGPKTVRALALIAELVYDTPASRSDPALFSYAHGGKDGFPYPVDRPTYDRNIEILGTAVAQAKNRQERTAGRPEAAGGRVAQGRERACSGAAALSRRWPAPGAAAGAAAAASSFVSRLRNQAAGLPSGRLFAADQVRGSKSAGAGGTPVRTNNGRNSGSCGRLVWPEPREGARSTSNLMGSGSSSSGYVLLFTPLATRPSEMVSHIGRPILCLPNPSLINCSSSAEAQASTNSGYKSDFSREGVLVLS